MTPRRHTLRSDTRAVSRRSLLGGTAGLAAGAAGAASLTGCGASTARGKVAIDYWLWDALQLPAYSAAIDRFMEKTEVGALQQQLAGVSAQLASLPDERVAAHPLFHQAQADMVLLQHEAERLRAECAAVGTPVGEWL